MRLIRLRPGRCVGGDCDSYKPPQLSLLLLSYGSSIYHLPQDWRPSGDWQILVGRLLIMDPNGQRTWFIGNLLVVASILHWGDLNNLRLLGTPLQVFLITFPTVSGGNIHHNGHHHPRYEGRNNLPGIAPRADRGDGKHCSHTLHLVPTRSAPVPPGTPHCLTHDSYGDWRPSGDWQILVGRLLIMDPNGQRTWFIGNLLVVASILHWGDLNNLRLLGTPLQVFLITFPTVSGGNIHHNGHHHPRYEGRNNLPGIAPRADRGDGKHCSHTLHLVPTRSAPVPPGTPHCLTHDSYGRGRAAQFPGIPVSLSLPSAILDKDYITQRRCQHIASSSGNFANKHGRGSDRTNPSTIHQPTA